MKLTELKTHLGKCAQIQVHGYFPEDLQAAVHKYNDRPLALRAQLAEIEAEGKTLTEEVMSGKCRKASTVAGAMQKARSAALAIKVEAVNMLSAKQRLGDALKEAHATECNRMRALESARSAELREALEAAGVAEREVHVALVADSKRREYETNASAFQSRAGEPVLSSKESIALDEIISDLRASLAF